MQLSPRLASFLASALDNVWEFFEALGVYYIHVNPWRQSLRDPSSNFPDKSARSAGQPGSRREDCSSAASHRPEAGEAGLP